MAVVAESIRIVDQALESYVLKDFLPSREIEKPSTNPLFPGFDLRDL